MPSMKILFCKILTWSDLLQQVQRNNTLFTTLGTPILQFSIYYFSYSGHLLLGRIVYIELDVGRSFLTPIRQRSQLDSVIQQFIFRNNITRFSTDNTTRDRLEMQDHIGPKFPPVCCENVNVKNSFEGHHLNGTKWHRSCFQNITAVQIKDSVCQGEAFSGFNDSIKNNHIIWWSLASL